MPMKVIIILTISLTHSLVSAEKYTLTDLKRISEANSPYIDSKNLQIKAAGLIVEQAKVWGNPNVSGDFGMITQNDISGFSYSFRVSQPIFFPGKLKLRSAFAAYNQQLELLNLKERKQLLQFNAIQAAYRYKLSLEMQAYFQARLNRFRLLRSAVAAKPIVSPEIRAQKFIIENSLKNAERDYLNFTKELITALETLRIYIRELDKPELDIPFFEAEGIMEKSSVMPVVLANNILIQKIGVQIAQAETNSSLQRREAYPDISIAGFYDRDTGPFQESRFGGGVSMPIPLFNRNQYAAEAADQYAIAAQKEREYAIDILKRDTAAAFEEYLVSAEMIRKFPIREIESTNRNLKTLTAEFTRSRLTTLTFADVEQRMTDTIVSSYMAQMAYVNALMQIELLKGSEDLSQNFASIAGRK